MKIPELYIHLAEKENINVDVAVNFFFLKQAKKSTNHPKQELLKNGRCKTISEASTLLLRLYNSFISLQSSTPQTLFTRNSATYLEKASRELDLLIGKSSTFKPDWSKNVKDRWAVVSDFHIPFHSPAAFAKLMRDPAETLVIAGDFVDMYAASKYRVSVEPLRISEELAMAKAHLRALAEKFKTVYMLKGNHCNRPLRRLQEYAPQLLPLFVHPIDLLAKDFPNVKVISQMVDNTSPATPSVWTGNINLDFMAQIGELIFGHFEGFCGTDAPTKVESWLSEWSHVLNLNDYKMVLQGHIHRLQMEYTPKGRLLIGTGCMCKPMEYQFDQHGKYRPPTLGYVGLCVDKTGKPDLQKTELIYLGD